MSQFRWGILGPGSITPFAKGPAAWDDHQLVAVGSRSEERAAAFAGEYGAPNACVLRRADR